MLFNINTVMEEITVGIIEIHTLCMFRVENECVS